MMKKKLSILSAGIALSCSLIAAPTTSGQIVVQGCPLGSQKQTGSFLRQTALGNAPKHLGSGPIDMNNLPADVLNCEVCRQRLGLPPLNAPATSSIKETLPSPAAIAVEPKPKMAMPVKPELPPVPILGSPGLISPGTASQMAAQGFVVESSILEPLLIPAKEIEPVATETTVKLAVEKGPAVSNDELAKKLASLTTERELLSRERTKLNAQLEELQSEWQKRMGLADSANKETLGMLEKRTAEVTELQLQLKAQKEALAKQKSMDIKEKEPASSNHPNVSDTSKKPESKKKKERKKKDDDKDDD